MAEIRRATVKELAYKIKGRDSRKERIPRFAFLLGAGASFQSGIMTASGMINDFKQRIIDAQCPPEYKTDAAKEQWLTSQAWYQADNLYSVLFEQWEPKEIGRQRYIEEMIEGRTPSFGYVVLANLLASNYINTIITTNFDDLIYSACTTYTEIRPIVYAYGVMASEMRILRAQEHQQRNGDAGRQHGAAGAASAERVRAGRRRLQRRRQVGDGHPRADFGKERPVLVHPSRRQTQHRRREIAARQGRLPGRA